MATIKLNVVGATKSLEVYARANFKCQNCDSPLTFNEFQIDHIFARENALYGVKGLHDLTNLSCLCKPCNSSKGDDTALDFYDDVKFAQVMKIAQKRIDKKTLYVIGANIAREIPESKFARLFRGGMYYTGKN